MLIVVVTQVYEGEVAAPPPTQVLVMVPTPLPTAAHPQDATAGEHQQLSVNPLYWHSLQVFEGEVSAPPPSTHVLVMVQINPPTSPPPFLPCYTLLWHLCRCMRERYLPHPPPTCFSWSKSTPLPAPPPSSHATHLFGMFAGV
jgi:hypothetical protein